MDWNTLIQQMREKGATLQSIADATGMSKGAVHDLLHGRCKSVMYETGVKLIAMHKRVMRRKDPK